VKGTGKQMTDTPSLDDVRTAIHVLFKPGAVVEVRAFGVRGETTKKKFTESGYYSDHEIMAQDIVKLSERLAIDGVFWTIQTIKPELLARSRNRFVEGPESTTADVDVISFAWLPVDIDPVRASGISASDAEKQKAREVMERVVSFFRELGIDPLVADSGNGFHILIRIALGADRKDLVKAVLASLAERFDTEDAKIDKSIHNPARILKAYGTIARKGEPSEDRPHRKATLEFVPDPMPEALSIDVLEKIAEGAPAEPSKKKKGTKPDAPDLEKSVAKVEIFLKAGEIAHRGRMEYGGNGFKWQLEACPFNPEHRWPDSIVTITDECAMGFRCSHNSCYDRHWKQFRAHVETKIGHEFQFKEKTTLDPDAIVCGPGLLTETVRRTELVLDSMGLKYFERSGDLVSISYGRDVEELKDVDRDGDSVIIQSASSSTMMRDLDRKAKYVKRIMTKDGPIDIRLEVPAAMPAQVKDRVRSQPREVPFPSLALVTSSPVLLGSGKVHEFQSVFEESVMYVNAHTGYYPRVPEFPTREDALAALAKFHPIFEGFPFIDPDMNRERLKTASYSVVLSGCLSLAARPYFGIAAVPIHGVTAHTPRSGKTKIVETACAGILGHRPTAIHYTSEEEFSKHLLPLMQAGDRAILIDNVERSLESSKLCILVTGGTMRDRVLGESRDVLLKNYAVFWTTGNNLIIGGDLTARAIRCDIDPQMELPETRAFKFDPVKRAQEQHPELVTAALTILRAYLVADMPWKLDRAQWGGFVRWDKLICGALTWLDMADPFETRIRIANDDPVRSGHLDILEVWWEEYQGQTISFRKIQKDKGEVYEILLKGGEWNGYFARWLLSRLLGKTVNGLTLVRTAGKSEYQILKAGEERSFYEATAF
jgi:hypothetical protein